MGWLRRLVGGTSPDETRDTRTPAAAELEADERSHELEILRDEQARLDDLAQRQLRYARYAWQPPAQGGTRRADDGDASET